tara:strand:+ start:94 stop:936 length:843 start_codon:yes stop_codon:yes gene_type:complete
MKIHSAIVQGAKILKNKFIPTPYLDSELLLSKVIREDKSYILLNHKKNLSKSDFYKFQNLIKKRSNRIPIAYITGKKSFWNSDFMVTDGVLIPRPDTELVVETTLKLTKHMHKLNILDIGIGSGCILLSILQEKKNFYGTGIDISKKCIDISKINAKTINVSARLKLFKTNVDKFNLGKYDLIVSNPPYIKNFNIKYLEKEVANFEPRLALDGGLDGLSEIRKVVKKSSELIKRNGKLILEIGYDQKNKVIKLLKNEGFYINSALCDLAKNNRCIVSTKI